MTTTINSTSLDFESIKNNLKTFLKQKDEFKDYDFNASGISNILDVLAWNTHYNGLTANFALNESFLNTAQLRSSLISLSEAVGYIPRSKTSSVGVVNLEVDLSSAENIPTKITLPRGTPFTGQADEGSFTFTTRENFIAYNNGNGVFKFINEDGTSIGIPIYEGTLKTKSFIADEESENAIYVLTDKNLDINSVIVKVYDSVTGSFPVTYTDIRDVTTIKKDTAFYVLKESPNGYYELSFSGGSTLGQYPLPGYRIEVEYFSVIGEDANNSSSFKANVDYILPIDNKPYPIKVITKAVSAGGTDIEGIESIRKNAPFQYAAQNRMVTAVDYSSLILRKYGGYIYDIQSYGGEDALKPEYGKVFISIVFKGEDNGYDEIEEILKEEIKNDIVDLVGDLAVVSFDVKFVEPVKTYIETNIYYQLNTDLTTFTPARISNEIDLITKNYFANNTGKFNSSFRRSQLLALVDDVNDAVLSSRADVRMMQRINLDLDRVTSYTLRFPVRIQVPDDIYHMIKTSSFVFNNTRCFIRNRLNSTVLELIRINDGAVLVDNIGSYDPALGVVNIISLKPQNDDGGAAILEITATPDNESAISPVREDILLYNENASFAKPVFVKTR